MPVEHACSMQGTCEPETASSRPALHVDIREGWVEADGHCTGAALIAATRLFQLMPAVLPLSDTQCVADALKEAGVGSSAFRFGRFADTVIVRDGPPVLPGKVGTELRVRLRTAAFQPFVRIEHRRHAGIRELLSDMEQQCHGEADFIDAMACSSGSLVLRVARMADRAPWLGDRRNLRPDLLVRDAPFVDYQETTDLLWRFDRRQLLHASGHRPSAGVVGGLLSRLSDWCGSGRPSWCDVCMPIGETAGFLGELLASPGRGAVMICPLISQASGERQVNLGFWHDADGRPAAVPGHGAVIGSHAALESESY